MAVFRGLFHLIFYAQKAFRVLMTWLYKAEIRAKASVCGEGVNIYYPFRISGLNKIEFGNNIHINRNSYIRADGGLRIGSNVHVGPNLMLYTVNHNYEGDTLPYDSAEIKKRVVIEDNVWIGANVTVVPGATIGEGAIISAGSVVHGNIPSLAIVGSAPVRIIKFRDEEHYREKKNLKNFGGVNGKKFIESDRRNNRS
jgi:acetyltransferase-like isoleucine patch superfamily enzyme